MEVSFPHQRFFFTQLNQLPGKRNLLIEFTLLNVFPRHTASAIRIKATFHTYFRTVINTNASWHGEQKA